MNRHLDRVRVSWLRSAYVLPSPLLGVVADSQADIKAIRVLKGAHGKRWWRAENSIVLDLQSSEGDQRPEMGKRCASCGECCRNLPTHQIAIYATDLEVASSPVPVAVAARINVGAYAFNVLDVFAESGDCAMLGPGGCTMGERRPLWCKMFWCERHYGGDYLFGEQR